MSTRKLLETKLHSRILIKGMKIWTASRKILETILKVDKRTSTNRQDNKKTHDDV